MGEDKNKWATMDTDIETIDWFSEESDESKKECGQGKVITRMKCKGKFCDSLKLSCAKPETSKWQVDIHEYTQWTDFFSEEDGGQMSCEEGMVVVGLECEKPFISGLGFSSKYSYCDSIRLGCRKVSVMSPTLSPTAVPENQHPTLDYIDMFTAEKIFDSPKLGRIEASFKVGFQLIVKPAECHFEAELNSGTITVEQDGTSFEFNPLGAEVEASEKNIKFTMTQHALSLELTFTKTSEACCFTHWDVSAQFELSAHGFTAKAFDDPEKVGSIDFNNEDALCPQS